MSLSNKRTAPAKTAPAAIQRPVMPRVKRPTHVPSEAFQDALLGEIKGIVADIEAAHISPSHAMMIELQNLLKDALNGLYRRGLIDVGHTLNDRWIKPSNPTPNAPKTE